jgi:hypothetical protein
LHETLLAVAMLAKPAAFPYVLTSDDCMQQLLPERLLLEWLLPDCCGNGCRWNICCWQGLGCRPEMPKHQAPCGLLAYNELAGL